MDNAQLRATMLRMTFGEELQRRREGLGLSIRAAADKAGFSEALWRQMELGYRQVTKDVSVPVNPTDRNIIAAANTVDWNPVEALRMLGREEAAASYQRPMALTTNEVIEAIRRDPYLLPEAKEHFLNQYELLLRVRSTEPEALPNVARDRDADAVDPDEEARIAREVLAAEARNPHRKKPRA